MVKVKVVLLKRTEKLQQIFIPVEQSILIPALAPASQLLQLPPPTDRSLQPPVQLPQVSPSLHFPILIPSAGNATCRDLDSGLIVPESKPNC